MKAICRSLSVLRMNHSHKFNIISASAMPWGSRVFAVFDFNLSPGSPEGDFRLARSRETLSFLVAQGARTLLVSHRSGEGD